jgi:hypothetical protein
VTTWQIVEKKLINKSKALNNNMGINSEVIMFALIGLGVWLVIMYYLIKGAVAAAGNQSVDYLQSLVDLKVLELKAAGIPLDKIKEAAKFDQRITELQKSTLDANEKNRKVRNLEEFYN